MPRIVVIGAGVSGLTCALLLAKQSKDNAITVVAKHMPGDYDVEYTSPWAGANVLPMALEKDSRYERRTWPELRRLAAEVPESGIHFQKARVLRRKQDYQANGEFKGALSDGLFACSPWYKDVMDNYRELPSSELPEGIHSGCEFTSVCINTAIYLSWLVSQLAAHGVVFKRAVLRHISEAAGMHHTGQKADIVINASGLLACKLGGVMDSAVIPARGQIILVRNECPDLGYMVSTSGSDDGDGDEMCYTMTRALGGGTILGGTYQKGNWDSQPDPNIAVRIMKRVVDNYPQLTGGKGIEAFSIIRHGVGLRPFRNGGSRIEKEKLEDGTWVVHNYGHAGWGYQASYGCAEHVLELVDGIEGANKPRSKL